jgi:RNA polymerase sigma factor (sigma-70 family)
LAGPRIEQAFPALPDARVRTLITRHGRALMRVARHCSLCHDDALDAYQRALEIYVRRLATIDPTTEGAWMRVVVRHEAMAIRRARSQSVTSEEVDFDAVVDEPGRSIDDRIASGERVQRSAEALRALKPDEARALMMKAEGLTYEEIGARNGWTYTKVNRAITEGRRRFMKVYAGIESGEECERFTPTLEALAEGRATSEQIVAIRPHLRHCTACRATVRDLNRERRRRGLAALLPFPGVLAWIQAHLPGHSAPAPPKLTVLPDPPPLPGRHPTPSITDVFETAPDPAESYTRLQLLRDDIAAFFHRANASDVAAGIHAATATGGGRISTVAAIVAFCVSGLGAGAVCVVTGVVEDPLHLFDRPDRPRIERRESPRTSARAAVTRPPKTRSVSAELASVRATPTATPTPAPRPRATSTPAPRPSSARPQERAPISPAPSSSTASGTDFNAESAGGSTSAPPPVASAPSTGGEEFAP